MDIGFTHLHSFIAAVYLGILFGHFLMLALRKTEWLDKHAKRLRITHAVMGALLLLTGLYLMVRSPLGFSTTQVVKYVLVVVAMGLAILGSRRKNAPLLAAGFVFVAYLFLASKSHSLALTSESSRVERVHDFLKTQKPAPETTLLHGQLIYEVACLRCHGADGQSQYYKSKNLATTQVDSTYMAALIKNGKSPMPAFGYLNDTDLGAVITYVQTLKAK